MSRALQVAGAPRFGCSGLGRSDPSGKLGRKYGPWTALDLPAAAAGIMLLRVCLQLRNFSQPLPYPSYLTISRPCDFCYNMTSRSADFDDDSSRVKRVKFAENASKSTMDPANNPYLAHWNDSQSAGRTHIQPYMYPSQLTDPEADTRKTPVDLSSFKRHETTPAQARAAEDGPLNPFTGEALSSRYMSILKTRRDLPVHAQR